MNEQELIIKMEQIKKKRLLSRVAILTAMAVVIVLNYFAKINLKYLCAGYIIFCALIIILIGFPTQKKLNEYKTQLKNLEEQ